MIGLARLGLKAYQQMSKTPKVVKTTKTIMSKDVNPRKGLSSKELRDQHSLFQRDLNEAGKKDTPRKYTEIDGRGVMKE